MENKRKEKECKCGFHFNGSLVCPKCEKPFGKESKIFNPWENGKLVWR